MSHHWSIVRSRDTPFYVVVGPDSTPSWHAVQTEVIRINNLIRDAEEAAELLTKIASLISKSGEINSITADIWLADVHTAAKKLSRRIRKQL